jgi:uncharacterized protein
MADMFIDIYEIGEGALRFDRSVDIPASGEAAEDRVEVAQVRLVGEARRGKRGVDLRARLEAQVRLSCSRCLERFEEPISSDFYLILVPDGVEFAAGESELSREDAALFYAPGGKADLGVIAEEQVHLNLPLKPVCKADCQGLCPTCGANRNRIECGCRVEETDPRLAPLLDFKKRSGGNGSA